jgi:hypothetical protein
MSYTFVCFVSLMYLMLLAGNHLLLRNIFLRNALILPLVLLRILFHGASYVLDLISGWVLNIGDFLPGFSRSYQDLENVATSKRNHRLTQKDWESL